MKRFISVLAACALAFLPAAPTFADEKYVGGAIPTSGVLTKAGSPYLITQPIIILEGQTLTIEPGVSILANPSPVAGVRYLFDLRGSLRSLGTVDQPIRIVGLGNGFDFVDSYNHKGLGKVSVEVAHAQIQNLRFTFSGYGSYSVEDSELELAGGSRINAMGEYIPGTQQKVDLGYVNLKRNVFANSEISIQTPNWAQYTITNNYFYSTGSQITIQVWPTNSPSSVFNMSSNTFNFKASRGAMFRTFGGTSSSPNLSGNYWSTGDESVIQELVSDGNDTRGNAILNVSSPLTAAASETPKISIRETLEKKSLKKYKNCAALNKVFPNGITSSRVIPITITALNKLPFAYGPGYTANKSLDRDKDRISCEK